MKKLLLAIPLTVSFGQKLEPIDIAMQDLGMIIQTASRAEQRVIVEDFTGLLWPYCPSASFAISEMLDNYPETLVNIEWHSSGFTPSNSDFDIPEYSSRASMYGVGGIPHTQWNGVQETVGGYPNGNCQAIIGTF